MPSAEGLGIYESYFSLFAKLIVDAKADLQTQRANTRLKR